MRGSPITYRGQNAMNISLFAVTFCLFVYLVFDPSQRELLYVMAGLGLGIGVLMVLPIGGADMPVVVSLLNSYAGLAASATGFAIDNNVLIIAGALDGASGFLLSVLMSRAMNRSFANVIFGAFGTPQERPGAKSAAGLTVRSVTVEDAAIQMAYARLVIVVPGYGMAVAQARHQVRELAEQVEKRGGEVKYAIHPVAGRMPGHMGVLLAEANVPTTNSTWKRSAEFANADVALVISANDVVNPAAATRHEPDLRDADPQRGPGEGRDRDEAQHEPRLRGHRERKLLLRREDLDALQRRQGVARQLVTEMKNVERPAQDARSAAAFRCRRTARSRSLPAASARRPRRPSAASASARCGSAARRSRDPRARIGGQIEEMGNRLKGALGTRNPDALAHQLPSPCRITKCVRSSGGR
jgi:hypothetical protein